MLIASQNRNWARGLSAIGKSEMQGHAVWLASSFAKSWEIRRPNTFCVVTVCLFGLLLLASASHASMGLQEDDGLTGIPIKQKSPSASRSGVSLSLSLEGVSQGWDAQCSCGDFPQTVGFPVTFSGSIEPGQQWQVHWEYAVNLAGEGSDTKTFTIPNPAPVSYVVRPESDHTYNLWGLYGVTVTICQFDPQSGPSGEFVHFEQLAEIVTINLPPLPASELQDLNSFIEANGGMRDLILSSSRPNFHLGSAEYEGFDTGVRGYDIMACPRVSEGSPLCGGTGLSQCTWDRDWGCDHKPDCDESTYCNADPWTNYDDFIMSLPLDNADYQEFYAKEFTALTTEGAFTLIKTGRRALWDESEKKLLPDVRYDFADPRVDFAQENGMPVSAAHLVYVMPTWAKFVQKYGYNGFVLDQQAVRDLYGAYIRDTISRYRSEYGDTVQYWHVTNEMLWDWINPASSASDIGTLPLQDLIRVDFKGEPRDDYEDRYGLRFRDAWAWHALSSRDPEKPEANDFTAASLCEFIFWARQRIRRPASEMPGRVLVNEYGCEFMYAQVGSAVQRQPKFQAMARQVELLKSIGKAVELDAIGFHMHLPVYSCLTRTGEDDLRLNPNQLKSLRDSLRYFGEQGLETMITEMDLRMGIPLIGEPPFFNPERVLLEERLGLSYTDFGNTPWDGFSVAERQDWQGVVYEAILNACLAESSLAGIYFWGVIDQYNWLNIRRNTNTYPHMPRYPHDNSARAALFGDNPDTPEVREMLWPKPAYHGVRRAIENYFGPAERFLHPVSEMEILRFAANGNVLLTGRSAMVHTGLGTLVQVGLTNNRVFAVMHEDQCVAACAMIRSVPTLLLAGQIIEHDTLLNASEQEGGPAHPAYRVLGCDGQTVVAAIDVNGNLRLAGYLLVDGIPYCLKDYEATDKYFPR